MGLVSPQKQIFWQKIFAVAAIYLGLQLSILLITGSGWKKFWVLLPPEAFQYWDAIHYASLAVNPSCGAFYPLWPDLVRTLRAPSTLAEALRFAIPLSEVIFLASLPLALHSFNRILKHRNLALLVFVLYALGPNSIFYAIGYTEALFGALSLLFLLSLHLSEQQQSSTILQLGAGAALFSLAALTNLVRPALIQSTFAISFALIVSTLIHRSTSSSLAFLTKPLTLASLIGAGSLVGYGVYGTFCHTTAGDYLAPFQAQVAWGRTLAFRPWLLLFPRSLLVDLQGLYTPFLIFLTLGGVLWATMRRQVFTLYLPRPEWIYLFLVHPLVFSGIWIALTRFAKQWTTPTNLDPNPMLGQMGSFTVLYAVGFSGIHSIINFLANSGYLYSTARHYFGSPFAFIAIGAMLKAFGHSRLNRVVWVLAAVGVLWLGEQWWHYGAGRWLG